MRSFFVNIVLKLVLVLILSVSYLSFYVDVSAKECSDRFVMDLGWGSTGREVTELQNLLRSNGFDIDVVDGYFGWDTQEAVKGLQKDNSLKSDGLVGREVRDLINKMYCEGGSDLGVNVSNDKSTLIENNRTVCDVDIAGKYEWGDKGDDVSVLQASLGELDYGVVSDGVFGSSTYNALFDFQKSRGLKADGVAGPKTIQVLKSVLCGGDIFSAPKVSSKIVVDVEDMDEVAVDKTEVSVEDVPITSFMEGGVVLNRDACEISITGPLKVGEEGEKIYIVRELLYRSGYLDLLNSKYDSVMREAVKRFQLNHDLVPDGSIGERTLVKMNYLNCLVK